MTLEEFSNEFDVLLNSYAIINPFGKTKYPGTLELDEYEKSVFLTKAQEELVLGYYNGNNYFRDSFEKKEELRRYLSDLVETYKTSDKIVGDIGLSTNSVFFELPSDLWFITYESASLKDEKLYCLDGSIVSITPVTQDDYFRITKNPFRQPNERRVLRLDIKDNKVELVSKYNISEYLIRYIKKPSPIILTDLYDGLSINDISVKTECSLNPALHRLILNKAVEMALRSKSLVPGQPTANTNNSNQKDE